MADETQAAQGDTNAAEGSSDNATQQVEAKPAADQGLLSTEKPAEPKGEGKDEGLLSGNKEGDKTPESYKDFEFDDKLKFGGEEQEFFKSQAKEAGFAQEDAQKAVNMSTKVFQEYLKATEDTQKEAFKEFKDTNQAEWKSKDVDGTLTVLAEKALDKYGMRDYFVESGYVNDAKLLGVLAELGRFNSESAALTGGEVGGGKKSPQDTLWPDMNNNK